MPRVLNSHDETLAATEFLAAASDRPAALILEGEAGIGKTTLWSDIVDRARARGSRVLTARSSHAESTLAYGVLAELLDSVDDDVLARLSEPQRRAVDQVMPRALPVEPDGAGTNQWAAGAALSSILEALAAEAPVVVAIDDLQWLDAASLYAVAFAARRLTGHSAVLGTIRTGFGGGDAGWLQLPRPEDVRRLAVQPLSVGGLHALITAKLGRSMSRPTMVRIREISGGNPFYALELARAIDDRSTTPDARLPTTLAELVTARIERLDSDVVEALLAAACLARPTVPLVAGAVGGHVDPVVDSLGQAEDAGIVVIDGHRVRFTHPLLARGVYTQSTPARRRAMHRRLADLVEEPELTGRHRALAATTADPDTLRAIDAGAETARRRGAPGSAAELLDLAVALDGDAHARRIRSAVLHFEAGDPARARAMLSDVIARLPPGVLRAEATHQLAVVRAFDDSFAEAVDLLGPVFDEAGSNPVLQVQMSVTHAFALVNCGRLTEALTSAEAAVAGAERLGQPHLLSQALSMRMMLRFMHGDGFDESDLRRALANHDQRIPTPVAYRPHIIGALLRAFTGRLDDARAELEASWRRGVERGEEGDLTFVSFHRGLIDIWSGDFDGAERTAADAFVRAQQLGGDLPLTVAMTIRAGVDAHLGRADVARHAVDEALAACRRSSSLRLAEWPLTYLGFLEVSLGNYDAALATLTPLLDVAAAYPDTTEVISSSYLADAVEALIALG